MKSMARGAGSSGALNRPEVRWKAANGMDPCS